MTEAAETTAQIGHNSGTVLEMIENDPGAIYDSPALLDDLLAEIDRAIEEHPLDLTTEKGRKAIASLAASISRRKSSIEDAGLARTEDWRKRTAAVNALKRKAGDELSARRDKARKPLTDWEAEEKARGERIVALIEKIDGLVPFFPTATLACIDTNLSTLAGIEITDEVFGEYAARAQASWRRAHAALTDARPLIEKREKDAAELADLRKELDARKAAEAAQEAEAARQKEIEKERQDAAAKAAAGERDRIAKEQEEKDAAEAKAKEEADRRARDFEHREKIKSLAVIALREQGDLPLRKAEKLFDAIAEGRIPNAYIEF